MDADTRESPRQTIPHSIEAEEGVLGCVLLSPNGTLNECVLKLKGRERTFYDLGHRSIYSTILEMHRKREPIDLLTLQQRLKDRNQLEKVGGYARLSALPEKTPSAANLDYYLEIINEKFMLRNLAETCHAIASQIYDGEEAIEDLLFSARSDLHQALSYEPGIESHQTFSVRDMADFDTDRDPNAVIGLRDGKTTRYLCKGYGAWLIGPSGIGKSSMVHQAAMGWALGRPLFGMSPVRPLRVLIVQGENDLGDMAEMTTGVMASMGVDEFTDERAFEQIDRNLSVVTEHQTIGASFCAMLGRQIEKHSADLVFVDPLLSFAGIDVSRQDQVSRFLRTQLNPVLKDTGAVLIGAHHTGKPKLEKGQRAMTANDYAYSGIGSSDLVNWARAVMVMVPNGDVFELKLAKRGKRAWATDPKGDFTTSLWLKHGENSICWEQIEAPEEPMPDETGAGAKSQGGEKKTKTQRLAASNLHEVLAAIPPEGETARALAKRISRHSHKVGCSLTADACRRSSGDKPNVLDLLVLNEKLMFDDETETYKRGPNA